MKYRTDACESQDGSCAELLFDSFNASVLRISEGIATVQAARRMSLL